MFSFPRKHSWKRLTPPELGYNGPLHRGGHIPSARVWGNQSRRGRRFPRHIRLLLRTFLTGVMFDASSPATRNPTSRNF